MYNLIIFVPALILLSILLLFVLIVFRWSQTCLEWLKEFVVVNVFSDIIKEKRTVTIDTSEVVNNCEGIKLKEETRWLLKDIDITDTNLKDKIFKLLPALFLVIFFICAMIFSSFLLLDISFSCDDDDNLKDCFEYNFWNSEAFKTWGSYPIDCNSAAVKNGTVQVVCYKIVFNYGLAAGASYGAFKFTMVGLNVAASVITKVSKGEPVLIIRIIFAIVPFVVYGAIFGIQVSCLRVFFMSSNFVTIIQIVSTVPCTAIFVGFIPWKDLVANKKNSQNVPMRNSAGGDD